MTPPQDPWRRPPQLVIEDLDALIEGCQVIDRAYRYVYLNEAAAQQAHLPKEHLLGRTMMACFPGIDETPMFAQLRASMEDGRPRSMENHFEYPDGTKAWFELRFRGVTEGVFILSVDITERKRTEGLLAALMDGVSDGIIGVDHQGRIEALNAAAEHLFGYQLAEVVGQPVHALLPHSTSQGRRTDGIRRDGTRFPVEVSGGAFELDGRRHQTLVVRDIRNEIEAEARGARLTAVLEGTPDFVGIADAKSLHVQFINQAGREMVGCSPDEPLTRTRVFDYFCEAEARRIGLEVIPTCVEEGAWVGEATLQARNGEQIPVSMVSLAHTGADGTVEFLSTIIRDLREVKRLEAQVRQSQKMEALGQLAAGVAHDFNNLLTVVSSYCEMLLDDLPPTDFNRTSVEGIEEASARAAGLTKQLLAFSRRSMHEPRVLSLDEVVSRSEKMLRRLLGEDVLLTTQLAAEPSRIHVDPDQLGQVLLNLAVNARDAMPRGGTLRITTAAVERDGRRCVQLTVSDTGEGIPRDAVEQVFQPFFTTKAPGSGTGLGLAVVHGVVTQNGGDIEVWSEPGFGTTFDIFFPATTARPAPEPPATRDVGAPPASATVLLVEDEDTVRELARQALVHAGYLVLVAADGEAALALAQDVRLDVLVTDVVMPNMSGREVAEALCARQPHIRVLYLSGYTDDAVLRHGVERAEVAFLQKPYTPSRLRSKLREVLDKDTDPGKPRQV